MSIYNVHVMLFTVHCTCVYTCVCVFFSEPAVSEQLPFFPYHLLLEILRKHPASDEVGVACRHGVMKEGVVHQILIALSSFGHQPRTRPIHSASNAIKLVYMYMHVMYNYAIQHVCTVALDLSQFHVIPGRPEARRYGIGTAPLLG